MSRPASANPDIIWALVPNDEERFQKLPRHPPFFSALAPGFDGHHQREQTDKQQTAGYATTHGFDSQITQVIAESEKQND
jgi:hypothetical protein